MEEPIWQETFRAVFEKESAALEASEFLAKQMAEQERGLSVIYR